jgi:arsenate reductase-like glutaredoxin family protein
MGEQPAALEVVDLNKGITEAQLDVLIGRRDHLLFLNPKNELYRERAMKQNPPPRAEAIKMMAAHPNLIRRPILVAGDQILLGFQSDHWRIALGK